MGMHEGMSLLDRMGMFVGMRVSVDVIVRHMAVHRAAVVFMLMTVLLALATDRKAKGPAEAAGVG